MTKREERELFFKAMFMTQFLEDLDESEELITNFLDAEGKSEYLETYMSRMQNLLSHLIEIDDLINSLADGWKTSRLAKVDLALLRVAIFEMNYEGLTKSIAINEAVELAKLYGEERSYAFINGILGRVGE